MNKLPPGLPTFDSMMRPTVQALRELGGSGTTAEIYRKVSELLGLPEEVLAVPHGDSAQSEVDYRLAWTRTYLKKVGLLNNSGRGVWALSSDAVTPDSFEPQEIVRTVREAHRAASNGKAASSPVADLLLPEPEPEEAPGWQEELHRVLLALKPDAFERLAQRLLRESGFIEVEVTGKSNDGGIDGIGIARVSGFLSFRVLFQCKRYQGAVTPSQIRDFRGAMQGRTDKGLFITTGTFTREAIREATRDGAPPIDLIDGEQLVRRIKELKLGVTIRLVEAVEIDPHWFASL